MQTQMSNKRRIKSRDGSGNEVLDSIFAPFNASHLTYCIYLDVSTFSTTKEKAHSLGQIDTFNPLPLLKTKASTHYSP